MEYVGFEPKEFDEGLERLDHVLAAHPPTSLRDSRLIRDPAAIAQLWLLREKAVGLLAKLDGQRQGIPFIGDTAVPPERLAAYVGELCGLSDGGGLQYGMSGHADVGCLHVRPFIDMKRPEEEALVRPLSDAVAAMTKRYGGLLWGEHGRGFRGEYSPTFFGPMSCCRFGGHRV